MRRLVVVAAFAVVLVANGWGYYAALKNRASSLGGTLELTEREAPLEEMPGESTAVVLGLRWHIDAPDPHRRGLPLWLDAAKLTQLGFDCSFPLDHPEAPHHYAAQLFRPVFIVLELATPGTNNAPSDDRPSSRLQVVDAGSDPRRLRELHPDPQRSVITRSVVRVSHYRPPFEGTTNAPVPQLRGWIQGPLPSQVCVPAPLTRTLLALGQASTDGAGKAADAPRYAVTIAWGENYEPWVKSVRTLADEGKKPSR